MVRHIGITGHRSHVHIEALNRFDFATVLFPVNRVLAAHRDDMNDFRLLLEIAQQKDVGTIAIKSVAMRPWQAPMHMYKTWYEPFDRQADIHARSVVHSESWGDDGGNALGSASVAQSARRGQTVQSVGPP